MGLSVIAWAMIALWHFAVLVPDHFWGGIIGAAQGIDRPPL